MNVNVQKLNPVTNVEPVIINYNGSKVKGKKVIYKRGVKLPAN